MHVYLIGFMGAGKTTVGRVLADRLHRPFVDLDMLIEEEQGMTIAEIFDLQGESGFRQLESSALRSLAIPGAVVATGGGILSSAGNREWMKDHGKTVWLDIAFEILVSRLDNADLRSRPLFENETQARALLESRRHEYGDSDLRIEVLSSNSVAQVAAMIADSLEERECVT